MDAKAQEMMKQWQEYATPGSNHKILNDMTGKWKYTSKWWAAADAKPEESSGTSTMKMILGGRFLQHDIKGTSMGQPFTGMGITGYDNLKQTFDSVWLDSMGTGVMHGTGTFDTATKTLKDSGTFSSPSAPSKTEKYRSEWQIVDKNKMVYSMFGSAPEGGAEYKQMEMTFTRTK